MTFVGREHELDALAQSVAMAVELSLGRCVLVFGPPGAGKSALVTEALARAGREWPRLALARGRCLQTFGAADPYLPFVAALEDLADEATEGSVNRDKLSGLLTELAPYWLSVVPVVGGILSATFATAARLRGQGGDAAPSREALFVQYVEVIRRLAEQSPLVLYLDDLHWADPSSIALLSHLARAIERLPVVVVGTFRTGEADQERHPILELSRELEREGLARRLDLGELEEGAIGPLLAGELGGAVSEPLRRWLLQTAGANPLFLVELVRLLVQSGAVAERHGEWFLTEAVEAIQLPRSAEAVIENRIHRLDAEEIRILQYASVAGNPFNSTVLAGLLDADELDLLDTLERLERRHQMLETIDEIDLPDGDTATVFGFRHALVQTVLYKQVVGKRRILLHRKAGELLEAMHGASPEGVAGTLARHFQQGRLPEAAHRYARIAADRARRVFAHWEAEELFRIALETAATDPERLELQERLGDVYDAVALYAEGIARFREALGLGPEPETALRLRRKVHVLERRAGLRPAPALLQNARSLLEEAMPFPRERCQLLLELSFFPTASGAAEAAEEAVRIACDMDDAMLHVDALRQLAVTYIFNEGQTPAALPLLEQAREILAAREDPVRLSSCLNVAAIAHAKHGAYDQARSELEELLHLTERLGDPSKISIACSNLGAVLMRLDSPEEAEPLLERARAINEHRDRSGLVHSVLNLAECARLTHRFEVAAERFRELLERARELEYWTSEVVAYAGLGLCAIAEDRVGEARDAAYSALVVLADHDEWFEDRELLELLLARLEVLEGRAASALERLSRASAALRPVDVFAWARTELERVAVARRVDAGGARALLEEVAEALRDVHSPLLRRELESMHEELERTAPDALPSAHPA